MGQTLSFLIYSTTSPLSLNWSDNFVMSNAYVLDAVLDVEVSNDYDSHEF